MPNRIIKESICESRKLSEISFFAEDLYKRLITYADDYGRFNADYQVLRARLYPREIEIVTDEDIEDAMTELIGAGKIRFYTSAPRKEIYGCFPNWNEHQRVRDSKKKIPDPSDTTVNDWYLKRYIPPDLKVRIIERDKFKCRECGKFICAGEVSAKRLVKMGSGLFHIDHIVPVIQGGRATEENLRLLCPRCNLKRKKTYTVEEIIELTKSDDASPIVAASCRKLPPESNPIQSESESESESEVEVESEARARKVSAPAAPADDRIIAFDGTDITEDIQRHDLAEQMVRQYNVNTSEPTLTALIEDLSTYGEERMREVLNTAALSDTRGKVTVQYWRAILNGNGKPRGKPPDGGAYMHRQYSDADFRAMEVDLDNEIEGVT